MAARSSRHHFLPKVTWRLLGWGHAKSTLSQCSGFPSSVIRLHESEDSGLALALDFVPGCDLSNIASRRWAPAKKVSVFRVLCTAVRFAHENGVQRAISTAGTVKGTMNVGAPSVPAEPARKCP